MVRGLKKKLLIGLLSAAVVGTSLAPSVPLVGSFAQEVKADVATNTIAKSLSLTGTVTEYAYSYGTPTPPAGEGWNLVNSDTYYSDKNGTAIDDNTKNLTKAYVKYRKVVNEEETFDFGEVTVTSTPSKVKFIRPSKPSDLVGAEEYYTDETLEDIKRVFFSDEPETVENGVITKTVYYKAKDTSKATVKIVDGNEASTAGGDIKVDSPTIEQKGEVTVSATAGDSEATATSTTIKTGVDTVIKAILGDIPNGKKVKKVEATYKKDGVDVTIEGAFNEVTKEVSFELGKVVDDIAVTIVATVEDVKIKPTIDTSRLKDATAAFEGVTEVKQIGGELVVAVTPSDSKYLDDLATAGVISVKTTDGEVFTNAGKLSGRIIFKYDDVKGFKSATPKVVVSGGLANNAEETSGKDYSKVTAPYDVAIDNTEVLAAYKALHPDSDKNSAVTITATASEDVPAEFNDAISGEQNKNENIKTAITVTVTVKGGETATAAATATADNATADVTEFDTPIAIKVLLPVEAQGKGGYMVYRSHNNRVEKLTTTLVGGEGVVVNGKELTIYTKKLSNFTVLYDSSLTSDSTTPDTPDNPDPVKPDDNKPSEEVKPSNGTTATTNTAKAATTTKAAKVTTSTKKSSKTSSPKTADYAVNSLLALLTGAAGLFGITLINKKRKEDEE
ncbi:MAG: hypothetical protein IIY81_08735 [Lachnospiraceae bacterium]|nr:hypothetical protein [Lachnospiraceae bacterium]